MEQVKGQIDNSWDSHLGWESNTFTTSLYYNIMYN